MKTALTKLLVLFCFISSCHKETETVLPADEQPLPSPPAILYPPPNSVNGNCVLLQWQTVEQALYYTLQIATDTFFAAGGSLLLHLEPQANQTTQLLNLLNGNYRCRMNTVTQTGSSLWSAALAFSVYTAMPENCTGSQLISPQLLLPQSNAQLQGTTQTFTWQTVPAALQYRLQISGKQDFSEILYNNANLVLPSRTVQNFVPGMYFWRVMATNSNEQSNWSETRSFSILP